MNPWGLLSLLSSLYDEVLTLRKRVAELEAAVPSGAAATVVSPPVTREDSSTNTPTDGGSTL